MSDNKEQVEGARWQMWPLYAAGFTTAFGAHAVAANLVFDLDDLASSLLYLGLLLALYDGAEVLLKPVFGTLADRIGAKPVLLGGLVAFAAASLLFVLVADTDWLWLARLGQGAAASAFSPAASSSVARLTRKGKHGSAFGTYGFYKSLGYTLGPLLGGVIVWVGGLTLLFAVMTVLALVVAIWARVSVPTLPPLPRTRQTVVDLARRLSDRQFLGPTAALAASTAALSVGVGFLPVVGVDAGLGPIATGAAVSVLALCAAFAQPRTGRALDAGKITVQRGVACGLVVTAAGLALAMIPGLVGILTAAIAVGIGTGIITPLGFAALAASTPEERMGQTMGAAELGRELGDAGGPLIVAGVAAVATLTAGFGVLAVITLLIGADSARQRTVRSTQ
ncbi:MFS transporter [Rhodococcus sp. KBS0724]|uniref:MFS transporter n=1 Tax=Rhodococcus sp. KBS0724 TaxID=1179674 RepID=UPI0021B0BF08|nr:MFS transporter [Rhodococcus sp. KBS0724]